MDKKRLQQEDDDAELQRLLEEKHPELFRVSESNVEPAKQTHNPTIADDTSQSREITINTSKIGGKEGVAELVRAFEQGGLPAVAEKFRNASHDHTAQTIDISNPKDPKLIE